MNDGKPDLIARLNALEREYYDAHITVLAFEAVAEIERLREIERLATEWFTVWEGDTASTAEVFGASLALANAMRSRTRTNAAASPSASHGKEE